MRNLFLLVGALMLSAPAATAGTTETVTGSYNVTYAPTVGNGPTFTDSLSSPFSENLTVNTPTTVSNFFAVTPAHSSGDATYRNKGTATGTITVTFNFSSPTGPSMSDTAAYMANYNNDTDSVTWAGTGGGGYVPLQVSFANGSVLDIDLYNASDWTIYPKISFDLINGPTAVPEPASIALLGSGVLSLVFLGCRRRRRRQAVA